METQMGARFFPAFEVKETREAYAFRADLPGVEEKNVEITLTANRLTVSGKREEEKEEQGGAFYVSERTYGAFTRSFTLPEGIDGEHITAELTAGVLEIVVPKKPEAQPRKVTLKGVIEKVKGAIEKGAKA
jgi:HSP20 family protein